jgi:hypothetical protein
MNNVFKRMWEEMVRATLYLSGGSKEDHENFRKIARFQRRHKLMTSQIQR